MFSRAKPFVPGTLYQVEFTVKRGETRFYLETMAAFVLYSFILSMGQLPQQQLSEENLEAIIG